MAAVLELPDEPPITEVHIEGLAVLKIVKHCQESLPQLVTGSLLGLAQESGVLEITHAFPFPEPRDAVVADTKVKPEAEEEAAAIDGHEFQLEMMRMLRDNNCDNNCVGWYQSMYLGSYSTHTLVENQLSYQTDLSPNAVVVLYDPVQTAHGTLVLKCFRLTQECVRLKASGRNDYLDPKQIFEELPVHLSNPSLAKAFLFDVADGKHGDYRSTLDCTFDRLDLSTNPFLEKHLEFLCTWVDDLITEQHKFHYFARTLSRDKNFVKKKKSEEQDAWNTTEAPKRMESLLISNQIRSYCDQVDRFAGGGFSKLFLAGGLQRNPS